MEMRGRKYKEEEGRGEGTRGGMERKQRALIRRLASYVNHKHQFPSPSTLCSALYF